jgi:short-subunit dehydrogenase
MSYAIITGASSGIGKAVAERFLQDGYSVAVCGRNKEKLERVEQEWNERYPLSNVFTYCGDISIAAHASNFVTAAMALIPEVTVLVNNAGTFLPGNIADEPEGRLEHLMAVNLYSAYYITRAVLPYMKQQHQGGHIFNMCSVASLQAYTNGGAYSISKYALLGFSDNLRDELNGYPIKVTTICPGATYTPSWEGTGIDPARIMEAKDVADIIACATKLSHAANVEQVVMRPVKGDL